MSEALTGCALCRCLGILCLQPCSSSCPIVYRSFTVLCSVPFLHYWCIPTHITPHHALYVLRCDEYRQRDWLDNLKQTRDGLRGMLRAYAAQTTEHSHAQRKIVQQKINEAQAEIDMLERSLAVLDELTSIMQREQQEMASGNHGSPAVLIA